MNKYLQKLFFISCAALIFYPCVAEAEIDPLNQETLILTNEEDIRDVELFETKIKAVSSLVTACVDEENMMPEDCQCKHLKASKDFSTSFHKLLEKHPDWSGKQINVKGDNGAIEYTLFMAGTLLQAEAVDSLECAQ